jgi:hypothetical protein
MERRKIVSVSWLLQVFDTAEEMVNLALLTTLTKEKLLALYVIGMQKHVSLRGGHMAVVMI